jgi:succinylglutamate desuccinylase
MVNSTVSQQMQQFLNHITTLKHLYTVQELAPYTYILTPTGKTLATPEGRDIPLTLFGLIHGNEVAGIAILNEILSLLVSTQLRLRFSLAVALGNYKAVGQGSRYFEKDLNRSFGGATGTAWEIKRAQELTSVLKRTWYFVDFHQTSQPSLEPFFIFPYAPQNVQFAYALAPKLPVITHWHGGFSVDGMATDEFLTQDGGIGLTIETGQNGFSPYQVSLGAMLGLKALVVVDQQVQQLQKTGKASLQADLSDGVFYTWSHVQEYPRGEVALKPGLVNFQDTTKGEQLGTHDGKPLLAAASGKLLFPKYLDPVIDQGRRPAEIWRIIRPVRPEEFPK